MIFFDRTEQHCSVDARHVHVGDDDIDRFIPQDFKSGLGTYREPCIHLILKPFDRLSMSVQRYLLVVNEE
jgi:hypothetical protein